MWHFDVAIHLTFCYEILLIMILMMLIYVRRTFVVLKGLFYTVKQMCSQVVLSSIHHALIHTLQYFKFWKNVFKAKNICKTLNKHGLISFIYWNYT